MPRVRVGDYNVDTSRVLGEGSFGRVYTATHSVSAAMAAAKQMRAAEVDGDDLQVSSREEVEEEARIQEKVQAKIGDQLVIPIRKPGEQLVEAAAIMEQISPARTGSLASSTVTSAAARSSHPAVPRTNAASHLGSAGIASATPATEHEQQHSSHTLDGVVTLVHTC